ncbi:ABC transporter ATP-binding protein, partial [Streptomyces sp. SID10244]|nr:ABC transporter ATP-binding protein [Streptomyces sp. SID10244]
TTGRHGVGEGSDAVMSIARSDVHFFAAGDGDTIRLGNPYETSVEAAR